MMLPFTRGLDADVVVFDAMDELSKFKFAPPHLLDLEAELIASADLVFTGGSSLYEAKKDRHPSVHLFPSSVDRAHFQQARKPLAEPADQAEPAAPAAGLLRRDRRALRHRPARRDRARCGPTGRW